MRRAVAALSVALAVTVASPAAGASVRHADRAPHLHWLGRTHQRVPRARVFVFSVECVRRPCTVALTASAPGGTRLVQDRLRVTRRPRPPAVYALWLGPRDLSAAKLRRRAALRLTVRAVVTDRAGARTRARRTITLRSSPAPGP